VAEWFNPDISPVFMDAGARGIFDFFTQPGLVWGRFRRFAPTVVTVPPTPQLDFARFGKSLHLVHGSVIQTAFPIGRKSILGDSDFIPRKQRQRLGFINLESGTLAQRQRILSPIFVLGAHRAISRE
jgi:hypothetical protein